MKMTRRLLNFLTVLSLLVCVAAAMGVSGRTTAAGRRTGASAGGTWAAGCATSCGGWAVG